MDNTDGYSESFHELSQESGVRVILDAERIELCASVTEVAKESGLVPWELALGPGADFGLVGTIRPDADRVRVFSEACETFRIVGRVEQGDGVALEVGKVQHPVARQGCNYFSDEARSLSDQRL